MHPRFLMLLRVIAANGYNSFRNEQIAMRPYLLCGASGMRRGCAQRLSGLRSSSDMRVQHCFSDFTGMGQE